jgi:hypothetical protein
VREIKKVGAFCAVSAIPQCAECFGAIAQKAGTGIFIVQSTVSTARHISSEYKLHGISKADTFDKTTESQVVAQGHIVMCWRVRDRD